MIRQLSIILGSVALLGASRGDETGCFGCSSWTDEESGMAYHNDWLNPFGSFTGGPTHGNGFSGACWQYHERYQSGAGDSTPPPPPPSPQMSDDDLLKVLAENPSASVNLQRAAIQVVSDNGVPTVHLPLDRKRAIRLHAALKAIGQQ